MKEKNYIAVDLGATSGRVILATVSDTDIKMETVHRFPTPLIKVAGKFYWNIYSLYDDIVKGLTKLSGTKVESIGIDTWGVDFACVAKDGTLCMPRAYRDPYTEGVPEKFFKHMSREELYSRTGIQIMNFNSVFQLFAQKQEKSSALDGASSILFMPDALSYLLTGKKVCEYTILSTSALMNPRTKKIDSDILGVCKVKSRRFPKVVFPGTVVGRLTDDLAKQTGPGNVKVIAVAGHDTASAVASVPAKDEHFAYLSSGTWSLMGIETKEPIINEQMFELNFTNEGGIGGTTRLLKNITGMWLLEQCRAKWATEGVEYTYAQIEQMATDCEKSPNVIDPDDPSFAAPQDMPAAIAAYAAAHGFEGPTDHAHTIRLIYDSLAAKYAEVLHKLQEIAPFEIDTLHIIGGTSQNKCMSQLTADACGIKVVCGPAEGTGLGNVMVQAGLTRQQIAQTIETKTYYPTSK